MNIDDRDRNYLLRISEHCARIREAKDRFGDTFDAYATAPLPKFDFIKKATRLKQQ